LEFALRLAKDLKAKDARVWMDKLDIRGGQRRPGSKKNGSKLLPRKLGEASRARA
jgi:hypothetical protein